jgi:hypothetical protein
VATTVTTTMRVIYSVHDNTTNTWALAEVTASTGFTDFDVLVLLISNNANCCSAVEVYEAYFTTRESDLSVLTLFCHQLGTVTGTSYDLGTFARLEFDGVDCGTNGNVLEWQSVADFNGCFFVCDQFLANAHTLGSKYVVIHATIVFDTRNTCASVWVVFDVLDNTLTLKVKVYQSVVLACAAALVAGCNATLVVAAAAATLYYEQ